MFAAVRQFAALVDKNPSVGAEGPYGYLHLDDCGDGTVNEARLQAQLLGTVCC